MGATENVDKPTAGLTVLLAEDEREMREALEEALVDAGHRVTTAPDGAAAAALADATAFDVVVTDIQMPRMDGLTLFHRLRQQSPGTEVIIMTNHGEIAQVVEAMKDGAYDYLAKPFQADDLIHRLGRIASLRALRAELNQARADLSNQRPESLMVGQSAPMRRLHSLIETVAKSNAATLITGDSGTGKELVARMLHDRGARRDRPFIAVNCGALTENLIEAELFGHERGAFTGAERKRDGRFKAADGGTLFLDEIAELPAAAQAKLLRVIQEGTFEPVGSSTPVKVDVRLISATHRDLADRIRHNLFREDLYYRVNVIGISVPPLRERPGDLSLLVQHFLQRFTPEGRPSPSISPEAWTALSRHPFPGNVRELSHAIQHAVVLSGGGEIEAQHLPASLFPRQSTGEVSPVPVADVVPGVTGIQPLGAAVRAFEREYLTRVLRETSASGKEGGGVKKADIARALGISRKTLWEKLKGYGIGGPDDNELS
ncbi:MAG: sigma-54-dependent Fis family transcriptional regulator [Deltaproteobacteria bacterium]|nr:sigma-54-dependent Fis family transcriptional regulator [Deltaproteobacteria bacterium]